MYYRLSLRVLANLCSLQPATTQALMAMVRHFQELFDVKKSKGVYPQMNRVYQQLQEARNVMKHLKLVLSLGECMSTPV